MSGIFGHDTGRVPGSRRLPGGETAFEFILGKFHGQGATCNVERNHVSVAHSGDGSTLGGLGGDVAVGDLHRRHHVDRAAERTIRAGIAYPPAWLEGALDITDQPF